MSNQFDQQPPQSGYTNYNGAQNNGQYGVPQQQQWNGQYNPNGQYNQYAQGQYGQANNVVPPYARPQYNRYQDDSFVKRWLVRSLVIRLIVFGIFFVVILGGCGFFIFAAMLSH